MLERLLKRNVGTADRVLRAVPALLTLIAWQTGLLSGPWLWPIAILSIMLLITSFTAVCTIYSIFGWSTIRKQK